MKKSAADKQAAFVREYIIDFNGTQAAIRAGYAKKSANVTASRLLAKANIQAGIAEAIERRAEKTEITAERVLTELWEMHSFDIRDAFDDNGALKPISQLPDGMAKMISGIEVSEIWEGFGDSRTVVGETKKIKLADRLKAIELVGKHVDVAAFRERMAIGGPKDEPLIDPDTLDAETKRKLIQARRANVGSD